jgi:hypothetical protein
MIDAERISCINCKIWSLRETDSIAGNLQERRRKKRGKKKKEKGKKGKKKKLEKK